MSRIPKNLSMFDELVILCWQWGAAHPKLACGLWLGALAALTAATVALAA